MGGPRPAGLRPPAGHLGLGSLDSPAAGWRHLARAQWERGFRPAGSTPDAPEIDGGKSLSGNEVPCAFCNGSGIDSSVAPFVDPMSPFPGVEPVMRAVCTQCDGTGAHNAALALAIAQLIEASKEAR